METLELSISTAQRPSKSFYMSCARQELRQTGTIILSALGSATAKALTISELLKREGHCAQDQIKTELVERPTGPDQTSLKIRIEIHLRAVPGAQTLLAAAAAAPPPHDPSTLDGAQDGGPPGPFRPPQGVAEEDEIDDQDSDDGDMSPVPARKGSGPGQKMRRAGPGSVGHAAASAAGAAYPPAAWQPAYPPPQPQLPPGGYLLPLPAPQPGYSPNPSYTKTHAAAVPPGWPQPQPQLQARAAPPPPPPPPQPIGPQPGYQYMPVALYPNAYLQPQPQPYVGSAAAAAPIPNASANEHRGSGGQRNPRPANYSSQRPR